MGDPQRQQTPQSHLAPPAAANTYLTSQMIVDFTVVIFGWTLALLATNITTVEVRSDLQSLLLITTGVAATLWTFNHRGLYTGRPTLPRTDEISSVAVSVLAGAATATTTANFLDWHLGAWEIVVGSMTVFSGRVLSRGFIRSLGVELAAIRPTRVVIVGTGHEARELAELLTDHPEARLELAGVVGNLRVAERSGLATEWIGPTGRLIEIMHQEKINAAIVTATGFRCEQFRSITKELFGSGYDVHLTTGVSRMWEGRFDVRSLSHEPLIVMGRNSIPKWQLAAKRGIDIIGALLLIGLTAPIMALTASAIWLQDRGPILYSAKRAGRNGKFFDMHKFRSMIVEADALKAQIKSQNERSGPLFKVTDDPRITKIGRILRETSIDELPQLLNVLKGDMSLVGPRPALPEEEAAFDEELRERFKVRPGITGLWQVEARSNAAFNAYRRLDLHYVENWNIGLDLRILLATTEQVVVSISLLPLRFVLNRRQIYRTDGIATTSNAECSPSETSNIFSGAEKDERNTKESVIDLRSGSQRAKITALSSEDVKVYDND